MIKKGNVGDCTFLLIVFICIVLLLAPSGCKERRMSEAEASATFRKYVLSTIPGSVTNIRADQPKNFGGYRYTFRFNVSRNDLNLLTNTGTFVQVWNVQYEDGRLSWQWNRDGPLGTGPISGMPCYDHTREPDWFRPGQWSNPESYAFWKEGDAVNLEIFNKDTSGPTTIRILLFNEKEAEAYFVVQYSEK